MTTVSYLSIWRKFVRFHKCCVCKSARIVARVGTSVAGYNKVKCNNGVIMTELAIGEM